jgi:hypothetical protein
MFKRIIEHREMQQLRKDHLAKQRMRYTLIALVIMIPMFAVLAVIEAATPAEPVKAEAKTAESVPTVSAANQQEIQDIESFAYIVTKPLDELKSSEIDLMGEKASDPCYEKNALLPREEMIVAIKKCKNLQ